ACGGTVKEGHIELQGNHKNKAKEILVKLGYSEEQIEIS
ncbi:MAG: stress response translation initiation inhibitor YciH, partial [Candidatus Aenigmarchaeota archaeon]|nr:stress response translation initiation inhibitor YciH [Candidatus Aenigmarchaeota archaeon]